MVLPLRHCLSNAASQPVVVAAVPIILNLVSSSAANRCGTTTRVTGPSIPIMPSEPSTTTGAPECTTAKTDSKEPTSDKSHQLEADNSSVQPGQSSKARRKRYREKQRAKKKEEGSASTSVAIEVAADTRAPSPRSETGTLATEPLPPQPKLKRALPHLPTVGVVEVPVLPHYELRDFSRITGGKEENDQGLFATQKIEQGTRIISERPIITLTAPGDQIEGLMSAYNGLSEDEQMMLWNMRPAAPDASRQLRDLRFFTDGLAAKLKSILLKPRADRSEAEQTTLDTMAPRLETAMATWRLAARWHANRCSMTNLPMPDRQDLPADTPITGLFIERAHIRHSCVPNCFASYDGQRGRMNIHVARDIKEGEELTLAAFADSNYYQKAAARAKDLAAWGIKCRCEACDETNPRFAVHEGARERATARIVVANDMLTRLEVRDLPEVCIPSSPIDPIHISQQETPFRPNRTNLFRQAELAHAQSLLLAIMRDLKSTGCETVESVRWRNILVDRVMPARTLLVPDNEKLVLWRVIVEHARECERLGKNCFGVDSREFRQLKQTREASEAAVQMFVDGVVEALSKVDLGTLAKARAELEGQG